MSNASKRWRCAKVVAKAVAMPSIPTSATVKFRSCRCSGAICAEGPPRRKGHTPAASAMTSSRSR
jgi:hypothetical protein